MRLKSLELQGFKSFPDKTILRFNEGVTAVLGPNGSGKSNISDAVRWVLGELSSKSLRGTKMEDVIFSGSDTRRPMSYAEVTLVLDNESGMGHLASDYSEVTVTRRYFRSGTSEYLINRRPVRLRDVTELFMNTGLGKSGYSIIGQGKIAEIISQKSEDRRHIFEEAAGIAKYRYQKADAEKKLAEVDENCRNVSAVLGELTKRVHQLERDSEKARVYIDLYTEKRQVDIALWIADVDALRARYEEAQKQFLSAKYGLDSADSENADLERAEAKLYDTLNELKIKLDENERALAAVRKKSADLIGSARVLENDLKHHEEALLRAKTELNIHQSALTSEKQHGKDLETTLAAQNEEYDRVRRLTHEKADEIQRFSEEIEVLDAKRLKNETLVRAAREALSTLHIQLSELEGSHKTDGTRRNELQGQKENLLREQEMITSRIEKAQRAIAGYESQIAALIDAMTARERELYALTKKSEEIAASISHLNATLSAKSQKADALRRMDELFEGYAQSVRFLMNAADRSQVSGILGPVAKLIKVEPRFILAIETALGANLQNVVVEDETAAKAAIALLKKANAGRCTFYPITSVRPSTLNLSESERRRLTGYIGVGDEVVQCDDRISDILSSMLGRTLVFDNLDNATAAAKATSYRFRIVTLDGQIINAGGSFTGGSARKESGMLTRTSEIDTLKKECEALREQITASRRALDEIKGQTNDLKQANEGDSGQKNLLSTLMQAEKTQFEVLSSRQKDISARIAELEKEQSDLDLAREGYEKLHKALSDKIESSQGDLNFLLSQETALNTDYARADDALAEATKAHQDLLLRGAQCENQLQITKQAIAFSEANLEALLSQIEGDKDQIDRLETVIADTKERLASAGDDESDISAQEKALTEIASALGVEHLRLMERQTKMREEMKEKAHLREVLFRDYTRLESAVSQMKTDLDTMATSLWEEYELTYTTASELGIAPADAQSRPSLSAKREELRVKIKKLGNVNPASIEEYQTEKARFDFLTAQLGDLDASRNNLTSIVTGLEKEMKIRFVEAVESIGKHFRSIFRELFGGGSAEIKLTDPENALECGIEINAAPPGKIIKSMTLLSGGEQSFTAIALIFAILRVNPTPFCIFDEIEAALDEVNVTRFAQYMKHYDETQFIVITHRRGTMENADCIYGISMPERGISKVLGMNVDQIESRLGVSLN